MASNTLPTCDKCSDLYTDPRMLPCLHSFCKKCIEKSIEEQGSKQDLECPTCREKTAVPLGGVDAIPQDVRANNEAEAKRFELTITSSTSEKCERCIREDSGNAVSFCINCCEFLCKKCKEDHAQLRKTRTHELVDVGEKKEGTEGAFSARPSNPILCAQHTDENLKFYCETCETLVCRDCLVLDHKDHNYDRIEKVAEKEKADLLSSMEGTSEAKQKLDDAVAKREKIVQQIEQRKKAVDDEITKGFKRLYNELKRRAEALLAKSTEISLGKTSTLEIECRDLRRMRDNIEETCQAITTAVEVYDPNEVLSTKKVMKARLQALLKMFEETILQPSQTALMPTSLDVSPLLTEIPKLGAVTGGSCPSMSTADDLYILRAIVNKERKIKVTARDEHGEKFPQGEENVWVLVGLLGSSEAPKMGTTTDNGDGTYVVSFTPTAEGEHELTIKINGEAVKGSPFVISVRKERVYTSLTTFPKTFNTAANPWDVAIHDNGDLYVAAYGAHCVYVLTSTGEHKLSFGTQGSGQGQFYYPSGIAVRGDVVYVAENNNNRIQKLTIKGEHLAFIGQGQLSNPRGICLDPSGRIFVADYSNSRVQVFNEDGSHAYSITGSSTEGSNLSNPWGIAFDPEGQLHVVNYALSLVRIFTADGKYVTTYGSGQFSYYPAGIAIDEEGYSFVGENGSTNARLIVFNPQHQRIHSPNSRGNQIAGLAMDKEGFVWFTEYNNSRITQF